MKIVYEGPLEAVEIADTGQIAERGTPIDVASDLAGRLLEQADWSKAAKAASKNIEE